MQYVRIPRRRDADPQNKPKHSLRPLDPLFERFGDEGGKRGERGEEKARDIESEAVFAVRMLV